MEILFFIIPFFVVIVIILLMKGSELLSDFISEGRDFSDGDLFKEAKSDKDFYNNIDKKSFYYNKNGIKITRIKP